MIDLSPSAILANAAGIPPEGAPATESGHCAMCGVAFQPGDLVAPFAPSASFTNWSALRNPAGTHVCGYCQSMSKSSYMKAFQCLVASKDGVFRALANNEVSSVIMDPPTPPFIAHIGMVGKSSHITWRTPVSLSKDVFFFQDGEQTIRVNRGRVLAALEADRALLQMLADEPEPETAPPAGKGKKPPKPRKKKAFAYKSSMVLSPSFGNGRNGQIQYDVLAFAERAKEQGNSAPSALIEQLRSLSPGDVWALHRLVFAETTARGERITAKIEPTE